MDRNYTRKMRGGIVNIQAVKTTIGQLKDDVSRITADIETLGQDLELNGVPQVVSEEITNESAENKLQYKAKQVVNEFNKELVDNYPINFKNFNFTIGDLKQLINHKKQKNGREKKYNAAKLGFYEIYNKKNIDTKEDLIKKFEKFLNNNLNIFGHFKYTGSEKNKTNGWTFGGRKTKKNQKKSRKSRRHNKSRK